MIDRDWVFSDDTVDELMSVFVDDSVAVVPLDEVIVAISVTESLSVVVCVVDRVRDELFVAEPILL